MAAKKAPKPNPKKANRSKVILVLFGKVEAIPCPICASTSNLDADTIITKRNHKIGIATCANSHVFKVAKRIPPSLAQESKADKEGTTQK